MTQRRPVGSAARRSGALVVGLVLSVGVLTGCGGGAGGSGGAAAPSSSSAALGTVTTAPDGVQEITLQTHDDYVFTPNAFTVQPGTVRLTVTNTAKQLTHNFRFTPGAGPVDIPEQIPLLAPGQSQTITFGVQQPGDYRFECSFHTQLGQVGTMTVSG